MTHEFIKRKVVIAVSAALSATAMLSIATTAAAQKVPGKYVSGDFHNHSTCSDGSISMQKLVKKSTDKTDTPWGLDWFVQAGHGGSGNRNCSLVEDSSLATPLYPWSGAGPTTTWAASPGVGVNNVKGNLVGSATNPNMWRWQSIQEVQYQVTEYLNKLKDIPLFLGLESVVAGHEHSSMSVITGQMPATGSGTPVTVPGYVPLGAYVASGNANALAQWSYCFDRGDTDTSRGNNRATGQGNNWDCSVTGSANAADASWNTTARKLIQSGTTGVGERGHLKTVEAMKWMKEFHPNASYYVPAHLERAGPFNPNGNNGFNIEHLRNFNNAAPRVAFGMETQPGHGASDQRGEYTIRRNNIGGVFTDSVGGTTYGGTGVYGAQIGGVWDALLGEGRNFWFFASSDWHNRGIFGPDERQSTQDFYPGEYQRNYTMVRNGGGVKLTPQMIVDGLRTGNTYVSSGQIIDRLAFIACTTSRAARGGRTDAQVEQLAINAAFDNTDVDAKGCVTMGEKLVVPAGADVVVSIVARDPAGSNYSPYTFANPSLAQVGITQPLNFPVLDHIDVIRGLVTGYKAPTASDYAGQWPNDWISNPNLANVPAAAKNTSAGIIKTFNRSSWRAVDNEFRAMTFRLKGVSASQYIRLRGTNLPANVPFETDANGSPIADIHTNESAVNPTVPGGNNGIPAGANLRIPCKPVGTTEFNGCPSHLPIVSGQKMVAFDVAAWADLWFYSNPIYIEVEGATKVAGVN
jgi:hypothetical protein